MRSSVESASVAVLLVFLWALWASAEESDVRWGLAARYPGDAGIEKDPAVIYFSGYEDESWKEGWQASDWGCYRLSDDPEVVFAGRRCLEKFGPKGRNGASLTFDLPHPVDVLYHRVYLRFPAKPDNVRVMGISGVAEGMPQWKAMGSAGVRPTELPYFCATLTTQRDNPLAPLWYPYHIDQKGRWGDNWPIEVTFPPERWVCVEMMVKMNTPGLPDGELRLWVDGRPVYAKTDMRWRLDPTVHIGRAFDQVYRSKPFTKDNLYWADNRVIATEYIGPMLPAEEKPREPASRSEAQATGPRAAAKELFRADFEDGSVEGWGDNAEATRPGFGGRGWALRTVDGRKPVGIWGLDISAGERTTISFAYRTEKMSSLQIMLWGKRAKENFRYSLPGTGSAWRRIVLSSRDFFTLGTPARSLVGEVIGGITFVTDDRKTPGQTLCVDELVVSETVPPTVAEAESAAPAGGPPPTPFRSTTMPERAPQTGEIYLYVDTTRRSDTDRELHNQYGLSVAAPWKDGGSLFINFPEHLEYNPEGRSILRHWDHGPLPWVISPDGRQASYRVESPHLEGVIVEAFARVAGPAEVPADTKGVYLAMRITNGSGSALPSVRPLICFQYRGLTGFPQWTDNFKHNFILIDGRLTSLADLPTERPETKFKGCVVKGCPQRDTRAERQGGLIDKDMDLALSVVESLDGRRKVVFWWTPGKSMIANANIPCIHADPYFGDLGPGASAYAEGLVLFTEGDLRPVIEELKARDRTSF